MENTTLLVQGQVDVPWGWVFYKNNALFVLAYCYKMNSLQLDYCLYVF
jgi:hypothetical protein